MRRFIINTVLAGVTMGMLVVILAFMTGCRTMKAQRAYQQAAITATANMDSLERKAAQLWKDSAVYEEGSEGEPVPESKVAVDVPTDTAVVVRNGRAVLTVQPSANGRLMADCTCAAVERQVRYWRSYASSYKSSYDSLAKTTASSQHSVAVRQEERSRSSAVAWWWWLVVFAAGGVTGRYVLPYVWGLIKYWGLPI